ncbi:hypothetical protein E2542_SST27255 [Spatholobus suberectus]|nr:hypothetical protein E2542_SST27255 [Spatholobus suberectus]
MSSRRHDGTLSRIENTEAQVRAASVGLWRCDAARLQRRDGNVAEDRVVLLRFAGWRLGYGVVILAILIEMAGFGTRDKLARTG